LKVRREALAVIVGGLLLGFALNGCSANVDFGSSDSISKERVADKARTQLSKKFESQGLPSLPPVTCDDDLERKVGATTHCEAKGDFGNVTGTLGIKASVTSVDGSDAELQFVTAKVGIQKS
jgi:Domain of unknown function (DUF4333)